MSAALLDAIRALIQKDIGKRGLAADPHDNLFTACPGDFEAACRSIAETPHAALAVVTGFPIVANGTGVSPAGETDGPLGALFLARALTPLGVKVVLVMDSFCQRALEVGLEACGLRDHVLALPLPSPPRPWLAFMTVPWQQCRERMALTHLVALEHVGPDREGRCRNMRGVDITDETAPAHLLFEDAARQTPPLVTIGIGDGGNEIGMGKIRGDTLRRNIPKGGLIACRVPVDHLIVAGISNWGAYALAAGVAVLRGQRLPAALFDLERERDLLRIMVEQGPLVDGVTARPTVSVDGLSFEEYAEPLRRLGERIVV
jgi:D-glutamate cyclase